MNNNLEKFIREHRSEFDLKTPPDRIWSELDRKLHPASSATNSSFSFLRIAASVIILFGLGIGFGMYISNFQTENQSFVNSPLYEEHQEAKAYYLQRVNQSWNQISQYGDHQLVQEDLDQLDIIYQELKTELSQSGHQKNDIIVEEMIRNYRTRAELLETVLERIKSSENSEDNFNDLKSDNHEI
jgi:hypothetical protein